MVQIGPVMSEREDFLISLQTMMDAKWWQKFTQPFGLGKLKTLTIFLHVKTKRVVKPEMTESKEEDKDLIIETRPFFLAFNLISIDWNNDNAWAAGEGIVSVEVNTTVLRAVYKSW